MSLYECQIQGERARIAGTPREANPHKTVLQASAWLVGWETEDVSRLCRAVVSSRCDGRGAGVPPVAEPKNHRVSPTASALS